MFLPLKILCYSCLPSFFFKTASKVWRWTFLSHNRFCLNNITHPSNKPLIKLVSANIFFLPLKVYAILVYHHSFWKQHHKYDDEVFYLIIVFGKIISLTHQTNRWSNWYQLTLYYIFLPLNGLCYSCLQSFFFKHQQKYDVESDLVENEVAIFKTLIFFELNPTFI